MPSEDLNPELDQNETEAPQDVSENVENPPLVEPENDEGEKKKESEGVNPNAPELQETQDLDKEPMEKISDKSISESEKTEKEASPPPSEKHIVLKVESSEDTMYKTHIVEADDTLEDFENMMKSDRSGDSIEMTEEAEEEEEEEEKTKEVRIKVRTESKKKIPKTGPSKTTVGAYSSLELISRTKLISGDFVELAHHEFGSNLFPFPEEFDREEGEEEHVEQKSEESEETDDQYLSQYERLQWFAKYDNLLREFEDIKQKNNYFLTKLASHYRSKRMYHVLVEGKVPLDTLKKYEKQLDDFEKLTQVSDRELQNIEDEMADLKQKCTDREKEANHYFEILQNQELELGKEILSYKINQSKEIEIVEHYLKRQKIQLNNLIRIRLDYIKILNKVNDTQKTLDALDNFGPNLRLIDYEQLKVDNRNLQDKLEEKDLELTRIRQRCQHTMQILAHRREKADAVDNDVLYLHKTLNTTSTEFNEVREQVNSLKQQRVYFRDRVKHIKEQSGLLSKPKLLVDMDNTLKQSEILERETASIRQEYNEIVQKLGNLRANMGSPAKLKRIKSIMDESNKKTDYYQIQFSSDSDSDNT